jgi:hypothetical protein
MCALAIGCGSDAAKPDGRAAPDAVAAARDGLVDGDGAKVCHQFTDDGQRQLTATLAAVAGGSAAGPCERAAAAVKPLLSPLDRSRVKNLSLEATRVDAGSAEVAVRGDQSVPGAGLTIQLVKQGDRWLISSWSGTVG